MPHDLVIGVFDSEEGLLKAARAARAAGLPLHDAYTPFPVHGMDEALGLKPSRLPQACFAFGLTGLTLTLAFQFWVSVFDWPMNVGGKSFDASPALIPVAFELTVLCAGLGTVAVFLNRRGLFPGRRPALDRLRAVDDRFLLAVREGHGGGGKAALERFFKEQGALEVHGPGDVA